MLREYLVRDAVREAVEDDAPKQELEGKRQLQSLVFPAPRRLLREFGTSNPGNCLGFQCLAAAAGDQEGLVEHRRASSNTVLSWIRVAASLLQALARIPQLVVGSP